MKRTLWILVILSVVLPNAVAGQLTRLAHFNFNEEKRNFYLSPDGKKIAYELRTNGAYNTCVMDIESKMTVCLSNPKRSDQILHWSMDGKRIAYTGNDGIHIMNIDGSRDIRITEVGVLADWSPDGGKIAFTVLVDGHDKLFTCDVDGSHVKRLTNFSGYDLNPLWSPDGGEIVFINVDKKSRICVTNSDGTECLVFPQE